jgi:hypothetical protein
MLDGGILKRLELHNPDEIWKTKMTSRLCPARQNREFLSLFFITDRSRPQTLGRLDFLQANDFIGFFTSLPCARVAFSLLHNPRNASKTDDLLVMAGAIKARRIEYSLEPLLRIAHLMALAIRCGELLSKCKVRHPRRVGGRTQSMNAIVLRI